MNQSTTGDDSAEYKVKSAVLLIAYNRPQVTEQVFSAIRKAKPARLYFAADGPNAGKVDDARKCEQVRAIARRIDWDCDCKTLFSKSNQGCKKGVTNAIQWFFEHESEGIILEDDCLPAISFFRFCDELLEKYRFDDRIATITGSNLQHGNVWGPATYYFSRLSNVWGWATWKRFWTKYDVSLCQYKSLDVDAQIKKVFSDRFLAEAWMDIYHRVTNDQIDTWDYQLQFTTFFENSLCATPNVNLISNLGFHEEATHTNDPAHNFHAALPMGRVEEIHHPVCFLPEDRADYFFLKKEFYLEEKWEQYNKDQTNRRKFKRWLRKNLLLNPKK